MVGGPCGVEEPGKRPMLLDACLEPGGSCPAQALALSADGWSQGSTSLIIDCVEEDEDDMDSTDSDCSQSAATPSSAACRSRRPASATRRGGSTTPTAAARAASGGGSVRLPGIGVRGQLPAAAGSGGATRSRLVVSALSKLEGAELVVHLSEGEAERGFPAAATTVGLPKGTPQMLEFRSSGAIVGELRVSGAPPVPFGVQVRAGPSERINFVQQERRQRTVASQASHLEIGSGLGATGEGTVVEVSISSDVHAEMSVRVRRAKKKELARLGQRQLLLRAMERGKYASLLAQIARSKSRHVEAALIDEASQLLKTLEPSEGSVMSHKQLWKLVRWKRVTCPGDATGVTVEECETAGCPCNAGQAQDGEICAILNGAVQDALVDVAPKDAPPDKWLFQALVKAALAAPEGCLWKSGGKFLFTNEERNQSPNAIVGILERGGRDSDAGKGVRALVDYTEKLYGFRVTAIQLNFHPNQTSSHKQHRDIYGAGQKGGINCTCTFAKCQGTVCYSLGSSRQILTCTIADKRSKYEACGEDCPGCKTYRWMHSGSAMYFNDKFNNNNTHGVPPLEEACGPRISIALLCA